MAGIEDTCRIHPGCNIHERIETKPMVIIPGVIETVPTARLLVDDLRLTLIGITDVNDRDVPVIIIDAAQQLVREERLAGTRRAHDDAVIIRHASSSHSSAEHRNLERNMPHAVSNVKITALLVTGIGLPGIHAQRGIRRSAHQALLP